MSSYDDWVQIAFSPLDEASLPHAIEFSSQLYRAEGFAARDAGRESALAELMAHPELAGAWMILADGVMAGYLVLTVCYSLEFHGRFGLLDELYVEEPWRRQGVGKAAVAFVDEECRRRGLKAVRLEAGHANERALSVYRTSGYRVEERHLLTKWL